MGEPLRVGTMSDEDLACEICPDNPALGLIAVSRMSPEKRRALERLIEVAAELILWQAGVGPRPTGVLIDGPKQIRERP